MGRGGDLLLSPGARDGPSSDNLPLGAVLMVTASFFFALMASFVQMASERLPEPMVVFARNGLALLFIAPLTLRGGWRGLRPIGCGNIWVRTAAGLTSMYCFFYAIHRLRLADAVLLQYTVPLFLPLVEAVWLKNRVDRRVWGPLLLGFAGVMFVIEPGRGLFQPAALIGLAGRSGGGRRPDGHPSTDEHRTDHADHFLLLVLLHAGLGHSGGNGVGHTGPDRARRFRPAGDLRDARSAGDDPGLRARAGLAGGRLRVQQRSLRDAVRLGAAGPRARPGVEHRRGSHRRRRGVHAAPAPPARRPGQTVGAPASGAPCEIIILSYY